MVWKVDRRAGKVLIITLAHRSTSYLFYAFMKLMILLFLIVISQRSDIKNDIFSNASFVTGHAMNSSTFCMCTIVSLLLSKSNIKFLLASLKTLTDFKNPR